MSFVYGEAAFPSWVWEVGFTESYIDLLEDARQWLEKSGGRVKLVTIVKLEERKSTTKSAEMSAIWEEDPPVEEEKSTSEEEDISEQEEQSSDQFESDPASYDDLRTTCLTDDWVEPITGFLEMWRYDNASCKMKQDGECIVLLSLIAELYSLIPNEPDLSPNFYRWYQLYPHAPDNQGRPQKYQIHFQGRKTSIHARS